MDKNIHTKIKNSAKVSSVSSSNGHVLDKYMVLVGFIGLTFFFFSTLVFSPLHERSDFARAVLVVYGVFVVALCFGLIFEFVSKTIALQKETKIARYSAVVSLNAIIGFILPMFYMNVVLANVMRYLTMFPHRGTFWCEIRGSVINFYKMYGIYEINSQIIFWSIIIVITLFLWGGLLERLYNRRG